MKNPWKFALLVLVLGALSGFLAGLNMRQESDSASGTDGQESNERRVSGGKNNQSTRHESSAASRETKRTKRPANIAQISGMPGSMERVQAMLDFYADLNPSQFEREASKLDQLPANERILASFLLFGRWAESDPTAAMNFSGSMGFGGMFMKPTILQGWASIDPASAAAYLAANPREFSMMGFGGPGRGLGGASIIGSEWARRDPTAAMAWANSLAEGRADAIGAVAGEVAKSDPAKAAQMLAGKSGEDFEDAYQNVARSYGAKNFNEAQAWIKSLPANLQEEAMAAAIGGLSSDGESKAAAAQLNLMSQGATKNRAVAEVVADIAREDPQYAAQVLKEQGGDQAQRLSMRDLMSSWVNKDAPNALAYAYAIESPDVRDSALQSYVMTNTSTDLAQVILVAENIQDENERNRSMRIAASRWMREDEAAARAYVEQSQILSDDEKKRILNGGEGFGGRFGGQRSERRRGMR
ncbi:MAG: hypothetical protein RIR37_610 [Verrucomicrobiota bacterium]